MPTPAGHAVAGLAVAWWCGRRPSGNHSGSDFRGRGGTWWPPSNTDDLRLAAACVLLAVAPDLDILVAVHRAAWHSLTAALNVGFAAWALTTWRGQPEAVRTGVACALAWASHVGLDWLGRDSSPPHGVMALWPLSSAYVESGLGVFSEVSRRYWNPDEFVWGNLRALARELVILTPVAAAAWFWRRR